jgi:hypothetical protein
VTPQDVPPIAPAAPAQAQPQPGAIVPPAAPVQPVQPAATERRAQTETDTDPYIQRRIARTHARQEYKQEKREARQEYRQAKREADERFNAMRNAENTQSPRGELGADYLGNNNSSYYGSTGE